MVCRNVYCQDKFLPIGLSTNMEVFHDLPLAVKFPQLTLSRLGKGNLYDEKKPTVTVIKIL